MKAHPLSEHHASDYRKNLGYFKSSNGTEYQLGVTNSEWSKENGHVSDYTIHGDNNGDYTSGHIGVLNLFRNDSIHNIHNEWKIELLKRCLGFQLIKKEDIKVYWVNESNCVSEIYLGKDYPTLEKALK